MVTEKRGRCRLVILRGFKDRALGLGSSGNGYSTLPLCRWLRLGTTGEGRVAFAHEIILDGASLMIAADVLVESLMDWGVDTGFGLPGDGINGIMEALRVRQDKVRVYSGTP